MRTFVKLTTAAFVLLGSVSTHAGGYKQSFQDAARDGGTQGWLGAADVVGAIVLGCYLPAITEMAKSANNSRINISQELLNAESELANAKTILTIQERQAMVAKMSVEIHKYNGNPDFDKLYSKVQQDIAEIEAKPAVTPNEKDLAIRKAKLKINQIRVRNLKDAIRVGKVTGIRNVAIVGEAILVLDVLQRIYVYNTLEKDPTFSPSLTVIAHQFFPNDVAKDSQ